MDIAQFKRILTAFADEPSDVDIRAGKVVAQIREDVIDAEITYSADPDRQLRVTENGAEYAARAWVLNRIARLPQLADRILIGGAGGKPVADAPFITPSGFVTADVSIDGESDCPVKDVVNVMLERASNAVPGATSVMYITSDAGEGKTTVINRAARIQAERFKQKRSGSLIVPIPLSGRAFLTFDDAVIAALVNKLRFNYFYIDAFIELVRLGAIVPAFDGYEEMLVEGSKGEAVSSLGNLVQRLESSGTVFVAARKAFFEYLSFRTQAKLFDAIGDRSTTFSRLSLSRWNKEQFCEYGRLRGVESPEDVYELVSARLGIAHPLLTRAVLVRRLFDVVEGANCVELTTLLGANPHDYFFTFVDAIVKREASEKWLSRVSGEVMEPLLEIEEHHLLLCQVALEMWQTSSSSIRYDVLDVVVDIFCEAQRKPAVVIRQVKERVKQHSLLSTDTSRGQGLGFDHEDFQNFYLGEGLGVLLSQGTVFELQAFLSVNVLPPATVEQGVQCVIRHGWNLDAALHKVCVINGTEVGYSFCKENCSSLAIRLIESRTNRSERFSLSKMFFSANVLFGRNLSCVDFINCHFQPTALQNSIFEEVVFQGCEFERLELDLSSGSMGCSFEDCVIDSLVILPDQDVVYDPAIIRTNLGRIGALNDAPEGDLFADGDVDQRVKIVERVFRSFLRHSHIDDEGIRTRLGKAFTSLFYDQVLDHLLGAGILQEVPWRGQGVQRRYKLGRQMADVGVALERSRGNFDLFLEYLS